MVYVPQEERSRGCVIPTHQKSFLPQSLCLRFPAGLNRLFWSWLVHDFSVNIKEDISFNTHIIRNWLWPIVTRNGSISKSWTKILICKSKTDHLNQLLYMNTWKSMKRTLMWIFTSILLGDGSDSSKYLEFRLLSKAATCSRKLYRLIHIRLWLYYQ